MTRAHRTVGPGDTEAIARTLAPLLVGGGTVLLRGDLGAGKTTFVRGLAGGLGADPDEVSSPTFTLMQRYAGRSTLHHVDLYRVTPAEVDDLGLEELLVSDAVVAIEWPERLPDGLVRLLDRRIEVEIEELGGDARRITVAVIGLDPTRGDSSAPPS